MKKVGLLVLVMLGFAQVACTTADYSKMSANELNEALIIAVKEGSYNEVQKLVQLGAQVNQKVTYCKHNYDDYDSVITCTLLEYAARHGHGDIVKELAPKLKNDDINEALILAAREGHTNAVRELVHAGDAKLSMLSHAKCLFLNSEKCALCINKKYRTEALIWAAKEFPGITVHPSTGTVIVTLKDYLNVIKELLKAGADVNHTDEWGNTALIRIMLSFRRLYTKAQEKNRIEIIQTLLKAKADVNHANKLSETALILAIREHNFELVQMLLKTPGININYADSNGNTALITALQSIVYTYIEGNKASYNLCIDSQKIVEQLIQTPGINPHHVNKNGDTAIKLFEKVKSRLS